MDRFSISDSNELAWPSALQYLDLSHNQFTDTSQIPILKNLVDLKILKLNDNKLTNFVLDTKVMLAKLQELHLHGNPITYFFIDSSALTTLTLSFTPFNYKFAELSVIDAENLQYVYFKNTSDILHVEWEPSSALRFLQYINASLDDRDLANINLYPNSETLKALSLKNNNLHLDFYFNQFSKRVKGITHLDLSFNKIWAIRASTFSELKNLKDLLLNDNQIRILDWRILKELKKLEYLDIRNNYITSSQHFLESLTQPFHMHSILLANNPFNCTCDNDISKAITRQMSGEFHVLDPLEIRHSIRCGTPSEYKGQLVANVNISSCS